ncbi:MAG: glycosyltransferase family 39 protein [Deferribacterota bacterium]|nr:glycosyltransferase family 39 protein [Deferribacterota bacterium]
MQYKHYVIIYLIFLTLYLFIGTGSAPLFETTEGRYAEISREMYVNKDYITPTFEGIKHFHKPPFSYWMMVSGMKIFGVNTFGLRFFGVIFSLITLITVYFLSKLFFDNDYFAFLSVVFSSSSLLFLIFSRVLATDIYLTAFATLSYYFLFRQIYHKKSSLNAYFLAFFLGLAFLTKGPVVFIFTLIPFYIIKVFSDSHKCVFNLKEISIGFIIFSIVAFPWYIIVTLKIPELLNYFVVDQIFHRLKDNKFNKDAPIYYFVPTFLITFFPYILYLIKGLVKRKNIPNRIYILYAYILIPFIILSLNRAKLITYILPFYSLASIIASFVYYKFKDKFINYFSYLILLMSNIFLLILFISIYGINNFNLTLYLIISFWALTILLAFLSTIRFKDYFAFNAACMLLIMMFFSYILCPYIGDQITGYKSMSSVINNLDSNRKYEVITYKCFIPSISFYRNKLNITAFYPKREIQFEDDSMYKKHYILDKKSLTKIIEKNEKVFIVTKPSHINNVVKLYNISCEKIAKQRIHSAYLCNKE